MRLIPGKTKVKIEVFRKVTLSDVIVGLIGLIAVTLCVVSSLPGRWIIAMFVLALFALMLFRIDDDPMYVFVWHMLRYKAYPRRFSRVFNDELLLKGRDFAVDMVFNEEGEKPIKSNEESVHKTPPELAALIGGEEDDAAFYATLEAEKKAREAEEYGYGEDRFENAAEGAEDSAFAETDAAYDESETAGYEAAYDESYEVAVDSVYQEDTGIAETSENMEDGTADAVSETSEETEETSKSKKKSKKDKKKDKKNKSVDKAADKTAETKTAETKAAAAGSAPAATGLSESALKKTAIGPLLESMGAAKEAYLKASTEAEKKKALKKLITEENKILGAKKATEEEKNLVWLSRAERTAERKKAKAQKKDETASHTDMSELMPFTGISGNFIEYNGRYFGSVIEIDPIEFRFFSKHRRNNSIETCFGKVLRGFHGDYGANIVKIQRPIIYDEYLEAEYGKLSELKKSFESGLLNEEEYQARVEIQFDRINEVRSLCTDDMVIEAFYYLVMFDSDKRRLDTAVKQAVLTLEQGELTVRRLDAKGLALFLKYTNTLDFNEKDIDHIDESNYATWAMPESVKFSMRRTQINNIITHNMRVINYPTVVGDAWLAGVMSFPGTKVVVKITPMDKAKAIRAIDRSLAELRGQYMQTSLDSKSIELQEHIDTLSSLLVTLKQDNESILSVSIYITAYDAIASNDSKLIPDDFVTNLPAVTDMKKTVRRTWMEAGMRVSGMDFMQLQGFIGGQISAYDPLMKDARGIPSNTIAGMYPWVFAHISDKGGIKLGSSDGVPVFINFFRRDSERVNSNMVIVGKSGSGKSYATKSLLSNLASEDAKIFILDPENEYSELAHTLHGKMINVGNATQGRLNPFHIITALDDDESEGSGTGGSFATHLQFLEEFFRQILPDIDRDALEYLNSLIERLYLNFSITPETDLSVLTADDYPIFDDLYDIVLSEFERTNNEYLRQLLRSLVNYISKFASGGRNANIWNGPSTITTEENFSVFNFQSLLANRNTLIANAQMLLVLKYIDNEIIKNRDYNTKYGLKRKIVVVIDEAHVFIDTKFPVALDFMFQLAKRIRKYNGMQIVITQNIKDFVGSEEIARKSTAIINACQYSFVFGLAPNDMDDLCKLYEKAGGINEQEQEDIIGAKRGQAFTIMSPTSRSSFMIEVPDSMVDMFENRNFVSNYFSGADGEEYWEDFVAESRAIHDANLSARRLIEKQKVDHKANRKHDTGSGINFVDYLNEHDTPSVGGISIEEVSAEEFDASSSSINFEEVVEEPKPSAVERYMDAEEVVNRKEYEMAVGRVGGISFQEISAEEADQLTADDYEEPARNTSDYDANGAYIFTEDDFAPSSVEEKAPEQPVRRTAAAAYESPVRTVASSAAGADHMAVSKNYIDETLEQFKETLRQDMERELAEKIKWITLGAGLATGNANFMAAAGGGASAGSTVTSSAVSGGMTAGGNMVTMTRGTAASSDLDEIDEEESLGTGLSEEIDDFSLGEEDEDYGFDEEEEEDFETDESDSLGFGDEEAEDEEDEEDFSFDEEDEEDEEDSFSFDEDEEDSEDEDSEDEEDEFSFDEDEDDDDDLYSDDESEEYEPAPFLFSELLAEAAEEYADMDIEERMEEMGEEVMEITLEDLVAYIKKQRKKKNA